MLPRLPLRSLLIAGLVLAVAAPAAADLGGRKHALDDRVASLQGRIAGARAREQALAAQIDSVTVRIRSLEARVGDVSMRLASLQDDLALHRTRLAKITALYQLQTRRLGILKREYALAVQRLGERLVEIYKAGDTTTIDVLVNARSLSDILDQLDYMNAIATQDKQIARQVGTARRGMRRARTRTAAMQARVSAETRVISYRAAQQATLRNQLLASRSTLTTARGHTQRALAAVRDQERAWTDEANALSSASAQLSAQLQAAQAPPGPGASGTAPPASGAPASAGGLIWPVSGPITSPFGMRWGSLHPGLDIGAGMGTPIKAAAAGRVIVAAYSGGYGNLVVIDHGNGIATAYAHQSQIAVSVGQQVGQGQVIGYVGSTGFSTGPHLHFEVRVNGTPVDPMGYL